MNNQPKVLLIQEDEEMSKGLHDTAIGSFQVVVEQSAEHAVNRIGFEDFDLVVVDAQLDALPITTSLVDSFRRMHIPFMFFGKKPAGMNGYPVLAREDSSKFVDKVSGLLGLVHT